MIRMTAFLLPLLALAQLPAAQAQEAGKRVLGVPIPPVGKFNVCAPPPDCSPTMSCDIVAHVDTRDCTTCFLSNPFGGCAARGNDPMCEASKAHQNTLYQAEAAGRKLDCERLKMQSVATCRAAGEHATAACEASKRDAANAALPVQRQYQKLMDLGNRFTPFAPDSKLQAFVYERLRRSTIIPLRFHRFAANDSLYNRWLLYWRPKVYANAADVPDVGILKRSGIQSVGKVTFVNADYQVRVEDVIRAAVIAVFFEELDADGIAQLQHSGMFSLAAVVDAQTIRMCDQLHVQKSEFTCDVNVSF